MWCRENRHSILGGINMASFTNQATLRYQGSEIRSNVVTGELLFGVSVGKTSVESDYTQGGRITFIVTLVNNGGTELTGLTLTDDLGAYQYETQTLYPLAYVNGTAKLFVNGVQQQLTVAGTTQLQLGGIQLPPQGSAVIVYDALATEYAQPSVGGSIVNTVTLTDAARADDGTAQWTLPVAVQPILEIMKEVSPVSIQPNQTLSYRFTLRNYGNEATDSTLVLADVFQPALQNLSVTLDGQPLTAVTDYTYDEASGAFETVQGVLSVAAAESVRAENGAWQITPTEQVLTVTGTV